MKKHSKKFSKDSLHGYLLKTYPKTGICEGCKREVGTKSYDGTQHALIHGREYSLNREDYYELCVLCHTAYDYHKCSPIECNCSLEIQESKERYPHGWGYGKIEVPQNETKCKFCGDSMFGKRSSAKYCSSRCKTNAYRERNDIPLIKNEFGECQNPTCNNEIPKGSHWRTKYCSTSCRKQIYNRSVAEEGKIKRAQEKAKEKAVENFIKELMG